MKHQHQNTDKKTISKIDKVFETYSHNMTDEQLDTIAESILKILNYKKDDIFFNTQNTQHDDNE